MDTQPLTPKIESTSRQTPLMGSFIAVALLFVIMATAEVAMSLANSITSVSLLIGSSILALGTLTAIGLAMRRRG